MEHQPGTRSRLAYFPISFFAVVMGLGGLSVAWQKAQQLAGADLHINTALATCTAAVFVVLAFFYLSKLARFRAAVLAELDHPVKLNFFPTISISLLLLSITSLGVVPAAGRPLWLIGAAAHLLFTLHIINVWIHRDHLQIQHLNPAWFIPAVGNVLVPIAGVPLGYVEPSWFFFSIGMLFWIVLMTIVFYRVLFHTPIDKRLMPTLFILIAPPAVGFVAYLRLVDHIDAFARVLYYSALFLTLLMFMQARRFIALGFFLSSWAYSFPLAAITIASLLMYERTGLEPYAWIGTALLIVLTTVVTMLAYRTVEAIVQDRICVPEQ
ncbi:MAG: SLAC1 anion channel family protein [Burkholderiaceae bacterium]